MPRAFKEEYLPKTSDFRFFHLPLGHLWGLKRILEQMGKLFVYGYDNDWEKFLSLSVEAKCQVTNKNSLPTMIYYFPIYHYFL